MVTIYGEWCGKGIQRKTSVSSVDKKVYTIFAIQLGESENDESILIFEPDEIRKLLPDNLDDNVYIIPWETDEVVVNFSSKSSIDESIVKFNSFVLDVENEDPWVMREFNKSGTGEGLVFYPVFRNDCDVNSRREFVTTCLFKAKGEKHRVNKSKSAVQINPELRTKIDDFADLFATSNRFEQAVEEGCNKEYDVRKIGDFLRWVSIDVKKESVVELEESGLTWKRVNKVLMSKAREWYFEEISKRVDDV